MQLYGLFAGFVRKRENSAVGNLDQVAFTPYHVHWFVFPFPVPHPM